MNIRNRINEAFHIVSNELAILDAADRTPNVVYLGRAEYMCALEDPTSFWPDENGALRFSGMRIIRVMLEDYLQVAYVEGAK